MMTTSSQDSQVFVAKEFNAIKENLSNSPPLVPQKEYSTTGIAQEKVPEETPALIDSVKEPVSGPLVSEPVNEPVNPVNELVKEDTHLATVTESASETVQILEKVPVVDSVKQEDNTPVVTASEIPTSQPPAQDTVESVATSAVDPELEKLILQEQFRFCLAIVKQMKKRKEGFLFSNPVDPVQLNIPTYFDVIESPMDLSTIEKKLGSHSYKTAEEVKEDVTLMFNNCYKFNGMEAQVSKMGLDLQKYFEKEWEKLPKELKEKKKKASRTQNFSSHAEGIHRPKREVTSMPREPMTTEAKAPSGRKLTPQLKFASSLLRDLMKKHYNPYNLAFLVPVDPDALGIPQYRDIIKNPMDLSTMRKKMDAGYYRDGDEFEADVRLMFRNCYTFNAPGSEVYNLGKELEAVFDRKWADKPPPGEYFEDKNRRASQAGVYHSAVFMDEDDSGDDDADAQHIEMLKTQVQLLTTQLNLLTEKRARKKKAKAQASLMQPKKSKSRPKSMPGGVDFTKSKSSSKRPLEIDSDIVQELTYDQKRELSENINILTQDQLGKVLQIIRENTHIDESQGEEIELDIDSLDKVTLWKLYTFVIKHTQKQKRARLDGRAESSSSGSESGSESDDSGSD